MSLKQDVADIKRFEKIVQVLFKYELGFIVNKLKLKRHLPIKDRLNSKKLEEINPAPGKARKIMEELGGAFIKLGQLLSLRPDLIPEEYCNEFKKLQDCVPEFSTVKAMEIIEEELRSPIHSIFEKFEKKPIASASIGQVYKAKMRHGRWVAIKVRRPNVEKIFKTDIDLLYYFARLFVKHFNPEMIDPIQIVKEFEHYTENELDFRVEARNISKFYKNFKDEKSIRIPELYEKSSTSKILVMEYLEGKNILDMRNESDKTKKRIISTTVNSVFKQVFEDGFFHADPHPGNILVMKDGKIAFLDFGIVGRIDDELKDKMGDLFITTVLADVDGMGDSLIRLGMTPTNINRQQLREDMHDHLGRYYGTDLKDVDMSKLLSQLIIIAKKHKIKLPTNFVLLTKAIITVEGFAAVLNPDYNLVKEAEPYVKRLKRNKMSPKAFIDGMKKSSYKLRRIMLNVPDRAEELMARVRDTDETMRQIDTDIETLTVEMDHSSNRVTLGLIITALIIAGAMMVTIGEGRIFGISYISFISFSLAGVLVFVIIHSVLKEKVY